MHILWTYRHIVWYPKGRCMLKSSGCNTWFGILPTRWGVCLQCFFPVLQQLWHVLLQLCACWLRPRLHVLLPVWCCYECVSWWFIEETLNLNAPSLEQPLSLKQIVQHTLSLTLHNHLPCCFHLSSIHFSWPLEIPSSPHLLLIFKSAILNVCSFLPALPFLWPLLCSPLHILLCKKFW